MYFHDARSSSFLSLQLKCFREGFLVGVRENRRLGRCAGRKEPGEASPTLDCEQRSRLTASLPGRGAGMSMSDVCVSHSMPHMDPPHPGRTSRGFYSELL